jgi:hypothetical protein
MGILNQTSDGLYSMVAVIYRLLVHEGPMPAEEIVRSCTAGIETGKPGQPSLKTTLTRWQALGLFEVSNGGVVRIARGCKPQDPLADDVNLTEALRHTILRIVFRPENVADIWSTEGSSDFARGLAWWMAQDAWSTDMSTPQLLILETSQLADGDVRIVNNDVRMQRLHDWARFLGFTWSAGKATQLDPTLAVTRVLDTVLPKAGQQVPAADFIAALAHVLPVLDQGQYRLAVESRLRPERWQPPPTGWVSSTLSRALLRLQHQGSLRLHARADAGTAFHLSGRAGTAGRSMADFTHVERLEAAT